MQIRGRVTILFFSIIVMAFCSVGVVSADDALNCPSGFIEVEQKLSLGQYCCERGSADEISGEECITKSGARFLWGLDNDDRGFCESGGVLLTKGQQWWWDPTGLWTKNKCFYNMDTVEARMFIGCREGTTIEREKKKRNESDTGWLTEDFDTGFCRDGEGVFVSGEATCTCSDEPDKPIDETDLGDQTCEEYCSSHDGVFFDVSRGNLKTNPSVACQVAGDPSNPKEWTGVVTALGCIPTGQTGITNWIMKFGFFIAGALVVFRIIQGAIMIMTALGNPDKIQEGKAVITSAIIGLMVILGAVMLLQFMGVDFLGLEIAGLN